TENVDICLNFLASRGVNVQGLSAEEIRNGNLKAILGLFFSLSRFKQQQHQQQQYYQSLVELQQQVTHSPPPAEGSQPKTQQDMQSSLAARYATQSNHSGGIATSQKKTTRLPGPSRVPAAGSSTKVQGTANLNRRSQSFNSIDKNKPPQYANGNEKESPKGPQQSAGMNGNVQYPASSGQQVVSAIPSPNASKPWRSKSMNVKHSATTTMLSVKQPSPATSPTPSPDRLKPPLSEGIKTTSSGQKSMLEKFKLVNTRVGLRSPSNEVIIEDDCLSECGENDVSSALNSLKVSPKLAPPKAGSKNLSNKKGLPQPKDKEEKSKDKNKSNVEKTVKEEKEQTSEGSKKSSKIASLIPKGNKSASVKKESLIPQSSGIPKPGSKTPATKQTTPPGPAATKEPEKSRTTKGSQTLSTQKSTTSDKVATPIEGKVSGSSNTHLNTGSSGAGVQFTGNGAVQLPQQQYSHPNTATVAPFIYRTLSENETTSLSPADSCTSPTKSESLYSKTAKQCLEELSGEDPETRRMRTVKNIADLRQNLEETMSSLRGTQISHSTLETTFDSTVTTEVSGRSMPSLTSRSSTVTWRLGQASPRLQAGDAPSFVGAYSRSNTGRFIHTDPSRFMYTTPLRRAAVSRLGNLSQVDICEKGNHDLDMSSDVDVGGYMSDGDILGKSLRSDDINSGYLTDGGLNLYTRSLNRIPDLTTSRDVIHRGVHDIAVDADSWDDSSSASSGLSDTLDNLSTDDLNTSSIGSYSNAVSPRKNNHTQVRRGGHRSSTSSIDSNVSSKSAGAGGTKLREPSKISERSSPVNINQTDKDKEKVSDSESVSLSSSPKSSPTSAGGCSTQGLRQPGSKYPDIASPTFRRLFGTKAGNKPSSPVSSDAVKSASIMSSPSSTSLARQGSLDSPSSGTGSMGSAGGQSGGSSPLFSKPNELTPDVLSLGHSLASSPASLHSFTSGGQVWTANLSSSSAGSKDTPSYQSMNSLHTSSESIDLPLSHHGSLSGLTTCTQELQSMLMRTGSVRSTLSERGYLYLNSLQLDRNTLPKKGLRYTPSSRQMSQEEGKEWLRSHSTGGLQDTGSQSPLVSPSGMSSSTSGKYHYTNLVHGSSLSLVSSTSSLYSTAEEKAHSEQIQKLRRELIASQEKVATLTSQLSANSHLVAAFEKSLGNMTGRLQSLTMTAEQKESELIELRETIEMLKAQNSAAQAAIQGALNGSDHHSREMRIRRQHSSESVSSINSATSHSSIGSGNDVDPKKKKKKNWLRSSFKQAFGKKKSNKPPSSHSDIEELTDSSVPSSPKLQHNSGDSGSSTVKQSPTNSEICECTEAEAEVILQLKGELREKELKLTDIRLEALSSAHHLDQIREVMNRMQNEIEILKAENDRLKAETSTPVKGAQPPSESSSCSSSSSSRQSLGLSLNNLNITETIATDILLDDAKDGTCHKEGRSVKIMVSINRGFGRTKDAKSQKYLIGSIGVSGKTKWDVLDAVIRRLFKEYVYRVDPASSLGLTSDAITSYSIGDVVRSNNTEVPEMLPCGYLVGDSIITVNLKGVEENSLDSFVFDTLIPKPITQRYFNLLMEHRRIILSGPSGTGKTYLANKLAEYVVNKSGRKKIEEAVATFNVDHKSSKELRQYLANLADQCSTDNDTDPPLVIILDNLHHIGSLSDIFNGFLNCKYSKSPYIIGTMNQSILSSPNLELHHNFRWVLYANHMDPVKSFLGRYLRRKLIEMEIEKSLRNNDLVKIIEWIPKAWHHLNGFLETHSSSDVTIGPRLFLSCPMDMDGCKIWYTDLWNYSVIPYLLEAVREGLQMYGKRAPWEDPSKWITDTFPWNSTSSQQECPALLQLRPEDVGYDGYVTAKEGTTSKNVPESDKDGDPLMSMLMRLQEAANFSSGQSCDSDGASHHNESLDPSVESTL
ncbi:hypothetical protein GDO78_005908, partial [Eleutherodactylus coqui]